MKRVVGRRVVLCNTNGNIQRFGNGFGRSLWPNASTAMTNVCGAGQATASRWGSQETNTQVDYGQVYHPRCTAMFHRNSGTADLQADLSITLAHPLLARLLKSSLSSIDL